MAVCLTLLIPLSYCHTSHRTLRTWAWQGDEWQLFTCEPDHMWNEKWKKGGGGGMWIRYVEPRVATGMVWVTSTVPRWLHVCLHVCGRSNIVVKCLSGPISHLPYTQMNWHTAKPNRHKDRAEGITMQLSSAVCPDPVWGPLLSADSNELPGD